MTWDPREKQIEEKIAHYHKEQDRNKLEEYLKKLELDPKSKKVIENCKKHLNLDRKTRMIIRTFFDNLELQEYLQATEPYRSTVETYKKNATVLELGRAIGPPYLPFKKTSIHTELTKKGFSDYGLVTLYYFLILHMWFDQTELIKTWLMEILNEKAKNECKIKKTDSLGNLLFKLKKNIHVDDFTSVMKLYLRNVIVHSKWWIEKEDIIYVDKNEKIVRLDKIEINLLLMNLITLTTEFQNAMEDYHLMP